MHIVGSEYDSQTEVLHSLCHTTPTRIYNNDTATQIQPPMLLILLVIPVYVIA